MEICERNKLVVYIKFSLLKKEPNTGKNHVCKSLNWTTHID